MHRHSATFVPAENGRRAASTVRTLDRTADCLAATWKTSPCSPLGQNSDVTAEAAGVAVMDNSLEKVDEFMHISRRMRSIALQSAVGGMALSVIGMAFAATGNLSPVAGAISQEVIDVLAVLNALRAAFPPSVIHDL
jgi:Neuraminidase (sialidase)